MVVLLIVPSCSYFILRPTNGVEEPGMLYYFERLPFKNANVPFFPVRLFTPGLLA
jgi:hypothetical protein